MCSHQGSVQDSSEPASGSQAFGRSLGVLDLADLLLCPRGTSELWFPGLLALCLPLTKIGQACPIKLSA